MTIILQRNLTTFLRRDVSLLFIKKLINWCIIKSKQQNKWCIEAEVFRSLRRLFHQWENIAASVILDAHGLVHISKKAKKKKQTLQTIIKDFGSVEL